MSEPKTKRTRKPKVKTEVPPAPEQAVVNEGESNIGDSPNTPLQLETWPREDWKHLERAATVAQDRNVTLVLQCRECQQLVAYRGMDVAGWRHWGCGCAMRRWER